MISERSSGRGVSLRPVSLRSKKWGKVVCQNIHTDNMFYVAIITHNMKNIIRQQDKKISSPVREDIIYTFL